MNGCTWLYITCVARFICMWVSITWTACTRFICMWLSITWTACMMHCKRSVAWSRVVPPPLVSGQGVGQEFSCFRFPRFNRCELSTSIIRHRFVTSILIERSISFINPGVFGKLMDMIVFQSWTGTFELGPLTIQRTPKPKSRKISPTEPIKESSAVRRLKPLEVRPDTDSPLRTEMGWPQIPRSSPSFSLQAGGFCPLRREGVGRGRKLTHGCGGWAFFLLRLAFHLSLFYIFS